MFWTTINPNSKSHESLASREVKIEEKNAKFCKVYGWTGIVIIHVASLAGGQRCRMGDTDRDSEFGKKPSTLWVFWCISSLGVQTFLQKIQSSTSECLNSWWLQRENGALLGILMQARGAAPWYSLARSGSAVFLCAVIRAPAPSALWQKAPIITNLNFSYLCSYHTPRCIFNS